MMHKEFDGKLPGAIFTNREISAKEKEELLPGGLIIDVRKPFIVCVTNRYESNPEVDSYLVDLTKLSLKSSAASLYAAFVTSAIRDQDGIMSIPSHWAEKIDGWETNAQEGLWATTPCEVQALVTLFYE